MSIEVINKILLLQIKSNESGPAKERETDPKLIFFNDQHQLHSWDSTVKLPLVTEMEEAVNKLNQAVKIYDYNLEFKLNASHGSWVIQAVDVTENRVINTIQPEDLLNVAENIELLISEFISFALYN